MPPEQNEQIRKLLETASKVLLSVSTERAPVAEPPVTVSGDLVVSGSDVSTMRSVISTHLVTSVGSWP